VKVVLWDPEDEKMDVEDNHMHGMEIVIPHMTIYGQTLG
jgi:hypothetical protein